ncbi:MAG: hypothetical protein ABII12_05325 [Planctomycetota bacterium]
MAMVSACKLQVGRDDYDGQVRMEADHIDFAGSTKYRFRLAEIRSPRRDGDTIVFDFHGNLVSIKLAGVRAAESWIEYIEHPQTLADKLGVQEGHTIRVINLEDTELLDLLESRNTKVIFEPADRCDMVMIGVERPAELRQIEDLSETLRPGGAIWVVLPKSVRTITKANVCAAAREAGLDHGEAVDFSETQVAYNIVRPTSAKKSDTASGNGSSSRPANGVRRPARRASVKS